MVMNYILLVLRPPFGLGHVNESNADDPLSEQDRM